MVEEAELGGASALMAAHTVARGCDIPSLPHSLTRLYPTPVISLC